MAARAAATSRASVPPARRSGRQAEDDVGVGDGGRGAAQAVADRPRVGAGGLRAYGQQAGGVDGGDRAGAVADLGHVDGRHPHHVAAGLDEAGRHREAGAELVLVGAGELAPVDERGRGGGAAHVEGDEVRLADRPAQTLGADGTGGAAGGDEEDRARARHGDGAETAVGVADEDGRRDAPRAQPLLEAGEVAGEGGQHVGVDRGGRGALVLAGLGQDVDRGGDGEAGAGLAEGGGGGALVRRVGVGVEKADGDRGDAFGGEEAAGLAHLVEVDGREDRSVGERALGDLAAVAAPDQRLGLVPAQVEHRGRAQAADLQDVAEAAGGDEAGAARPASAAACWSRPWCRAAPR